MPGSVPEEIDSILTRPVVQFLCRVGGTSCYEFQHPSENDIGISDGIVGLTCPLEDAENAKVKIFSRIPLSDIVSAGKPGNAVIEALNRAVVQAIPCFLFIRRTTASNTPKWWGYLVQL